MGLYDTKGKVGCRPVDVNLSAEPKFEDEASNDTLGVEYHTNAVGCIRLGLMVEATVEDSAAELSPLYFMNKSRREGRGEGIKVSAVYKITESR